MPDITMCKGTGAAAFPLSAEAGATVPGICPRRERCWRFRTTPTPGQQAYCVGMPCEGEWCDYFWVMEGEGDD